MMMMMMMMITQSQRCARRALVASQVAKANLCKNATEK